MSRFFIGESDSDSGSSSSSDEEIQHAKVNTSSKFAATYESSSESEDEVRVVKSQKDRTWDSITERLSKMKNARKNNDWAAVHTEFDEVNKVVDKAKMIIMVNGLPKFYIKMIGELEDEVGVLSKDKEMLKKMKPVAERAFNRLKLAIKKHNKKYEAELADFRAHPEAYEEPESESEEESSEEEDSSDDSDSEEEEESSSSSDDSESEEEAAAPKKKAKAKFASSDSDSDSDSLFGSDSDSDSDSSSEDEVPLEGLKGKKRDFWLKKDPAASKKKDDEESEDDEEAKARRVLREQEAQERKRRKQEAAEAQASANRRASAYDYSMTESQLDTKVAELIASRGRKGTDVRMTVRHLEVLTKIARVFGPRKEIPVLMHFVSATFDGLHTMDDYLEVHTWQFCCRAVERILTLLDGHKSYFLQQIQSEAIGGGLLAATIGGSTDGEDGAAVIDKNAILVNGGLENFLSRLQDDYTRSLQQINSHTQEYIARLADEATLIDLSRRIQAYYVRHGDTATAATVALTQVEFLYYKHETTAVAVHKASAFSKQWGPRSQLHPACCGKMEAVKETVEAGAGSWKKLDVQQVHPGCFLGNPSHAEIKVTSAAENAAALEELCTFIFRHGDERSKARALLCAVYNYALHDHYHKARDMFLISHIQDTIDKADIKTQILYNRTLATLGLCAFRLGYIQKAHDCLGSLSGRVRELLAQGMSKSWYQQDKDPEQEKVEKRRQMPYHMHINPDLLECCFLLSAMFLDLPSLCRNPSSTQSQYRAFRKYFTNYNRQIFTGPPENTREHVLGAAKAMLNSDWRLAADLVTKLDVWNLVPGDGAEKIKSMLRSKIKDDGLRVYMLTAAAHYESISLEHLCAVFECDSTAARKIINKMIFTKEIQAAWELKQEVLMLYRVDATPLQTVTLQVADKLSALVECNERVLDPLVGAYGYKDEGWQREGRKDRDQQGVSRGGRGGYSGGPGGRGDGGWKAAGAGRGGRGGGRGSGGRGGRGRATDGSSRGDRKGGDGNRGGDRGKSSGGREHRGQTQVPQTNAWGK